MLRRLRAGGEGKAEDKMAGWHHWLDMSLQTAEIGGHAAWPANHEALKVVDTHFTHLLATVYMASESSQLFGAVLAIFERLSFKLH